MTASCTGSALLAAGSGSPHLTHTAVLEASEGKTNRCSHVIYVSHIYKAPSIIIAINTCDHETFIDPHRVELSLEYQIYSVSYFCGILSITDRDSRDRQET